MTPARDAPTEKWGFQFRLEGFQLRLERRSWGIGNSWLFDGDGLASADRKALRPWIAAQALIDALEQEPAFWEQVDRVRHAADAAEASWREARRYNPRAGAKARRRRVIQLILLTAASAPSRQDARRALWALPDVEVWTSDLQPDEIAQVTYALLPNGDATETDSRTAAEVADDGKATRPTAYVFGERWIKRVREGSRLVACRASRRCFLCAERAPAGDYCDAYSVSTPSARVERRDELRAHQKMIERLFEDAAPALYRVVAVTNGACARQLCASPPLPGPSSNGPQRSESGLVKPNSAL